ncbi:MAG: hypothetical protein PHC50_05010 [Candidatus Cloacimonetes bacterium]|nr:hypothetical protein [Candidatus Cloacimonadota bacterium]
MQEGSDLVIKNVVPIASPVVNYLTYIQAYCGINWEIYDTEHLQGLFLSEEERNFMQACAVDLSFGDGSAASLTELLYFLPAYMFRENSKSFLEYFGCLEQCYESQTLSRLFEMYQDHINRLQEFIPSLLANRASLERDDVLCIIKQLSTIYKENFPKYMQFIWDKDKAIIKRTCDYISDIFAKGDIIGKWEKLTGFELLSDHYQLIIVPSLQFGPCANSLNYGVNIFPALTKHCTKHYFDHFISHEIGTHILKPHTLDKAPVSEENHRVYYIAFENLAKHFNMKILANEYQYELGEEYYEDSVFESIYQNLDVLANNDISSMYFIAIEQYKKLKS